MYMCFSLCCLYCYWSLSFSLHVPSDIAYTVLQNCTTEVGDLGEPDFTLTFDYEFVEDFRDSSEAEVEEDEGDDDIDGGGIQAGVETNAANRAAFSESAAPLLAGQQVAGQQQSSQPQAVTQQNGQSQTAQRQAGQQQRSRQPFGKKNNWGPKEFKRKNHVLSIMVRVSACIYVYLKLEEEYRQKLFSSSQH